VKVISIGPFLPRRLEPRLDVRREVVDRIEIFGDYVLVWHAEPELLLDERDQAQHAGRVHDTMIQQGCVVG